MNSYIILFFTVIFLSSCSDRKVNTSESVFTVNNESAKTEFSNIKDPSTLNDVYDLNMNRRKAIDFIEKYKGSAEAELAAKVISKTEIRLEEVNRQNNLDTKRQIEKIEKELSKKFKITKDDFAKTKFYEHRSFVSSTRTQFEPYISNPVGTSALLRFRFQYFGESWVFFERIHIICSDKDYLFTFNRHKDVHRNNSSGYVWEVVDVPASEDQMEALRCMSDSSNQVKYRISGSDRAKDFSLAKTNRIAIEETLAAFSKFERAPRL